MFETGRLHFLMKDTNGLTTVKGIILNAKLFIRALLTNYLFLNIQLHLFLS